MLTTPPFGLLALRPGGRLHLLHFLQGLLQPFHLFPGRAPTGFLLPQIAHRLHLLPRRLQMGAQGLLPMKRIAASRCFHFRAIVHHPLQADQTLAAQHPQQLREQLIERYARRMVIENSIAEGINFFHMGALFSAVAMKVNCDLQLTVMASSLDRFLDSKLGEGYEVAKADRIFRDFVNASAQVSLTEKDILVRFQKRAHNPLLLAAHFDQTRVSVQWLGGKRLRLQFG